MQNIENQTNALIVSLHMTEIVNWIQFGKFRMDSPMYLHALKSVL